MYSDTSYFTIIHKTVTPFVHKMYTLCISNLYWTTTCTKGLSWIKGKLGTGGLFLLSCFYLSTLCIFSSCHNFELLKFSIKSSLISNMSILNVENIFHFIFSIECNFIFHEKIFYFPFPVRLRRWFSVDDSSESRRCVKALY